MNRLIYKVAASAMALLAFTACDDINNEDRFIPVELPTAERVVLALEFTGQNCTNCPEGAEAMHAIQESNPENVVAVNLHPTDVYYTQLPNPRFDIGLTSAEARVMYDYFNPDAFPNALFDGISFGGSVLQKNITQWGTCALEALKQPSVLKLQVSAGYDANEGVILAQADTQYTGVIDSEARIMFWVIENNMVGYQVTPTGPKRDYVHNHVLRASMNGEWGEVQTETSHPELTFTNNAAIEMSDKWVPENLQVVAFVFTLKGGFKVLQTAICDVNL